LNIGPNNPVNKNLLKEVLTRLKPVLSGFEYYLNKLSDGHVTLSFRSGKNHAKLDVNSAKIMTNFYSIQWSIKLKKIVSQKYFYQEEK
jgi:hypothetical protein